MDLKKFYLDPKFPGSYSGAYKFYQEVKNIHPKVTLKKVNEFLKSQDAYTLHKRTRKPKFSRTLVFKPRDLWQIDLLDMQKYSKENDGYRCICVIIDCFSRYVWVNPKHALFLGALTGAGWSDPTTSFTILLCTT